MGTAHATEVTPLQQHYFIKELALKSPKEIINRFLSKRSFLLFPLPVYPKDQPLFAMFLITFTPAFSNNISRITNFIPRALVQHQLDQRSKARFIPYQLWQHLVQQFLDQHKLERQLRHRMMKQLTQEVETCIGFKSNLM